MDSKYSVLISVYVKDNQKWLRDSLGSIFNQTYLANEVVLVEDGPIGEDLENVVREFEAIYNSLKVIRLPSNVGLGRALNEGLKYCTNDLVARMDADDICYPERFERQLKIFNNNPEIDIVSSWINEFEDDKSNIVSIRRLPEKHNEIKQYAKKRCPINHPAVMFRKHAVLETGGYKHFRLFEDYYLWARMLVNGSIFYNIQEPLLWFRVSSDMYKRRGGLRYAIDEIRFQQELYRIGFIGYWDKVINISIRIIVRLFPNNLRSFFYKKVLRT